MNLSEAETEVGRLSRLIDAGVTYLRERAHELAAAERDYRQAVAAAWVEAPEGTAGAKEAWVNGKCADLRYARDLADGLRAAALEGVRCRRTQMSAAQSLIAAHREEAGFARTGPHIAA